MKMPAGFSLSAVRLLAATAIVVFSTTNLRAQSNACAAITPGDVAPVVGSAPMKPIANGCGWNADNDHFVKISESTISSRDVDAVFNLARAASSKSQTVTDESGLGDKAYLAISKTGVATLQMMKKGRFLQLQLWDGSQPSSANLRLLHVIAAKAIAAF